MVSKCVNYACNVQNFTSVQKLVTITGTINVKNVFCKTQHYEFHEGKNKKKSSYVLIDGHLKSTNQKHGFFL